MKIVSRRGQEAKRSIDDRLPIIVSDGQLTKEEADRIQEVFRRIRDDLQNIFDPKGLSKPTGAPCRSQH